MSFRISRILHAGYILESQDCKIAFDPLFENPFSYNCYAFPEVEFDLAAIQQLDFSAVFISHYHDDHFSMESLVHLNRDTPIYFFSVFEELFDLLKTLGFKKIHPINIFEKVEIGPFKVLPLEALDADVDSFFHIQVEKLNILHVVDAWISPHAFDSLLLTKWDLVLWPFQTLREIETIAPSTATPSDQKLPHEWLEQLQRLNPRFIIPSSCQFRFENWSWLNKTFFPISYSSFTEQVRHILPKAMVLKMNPGETLTYENLIWKASGRLEWVKLLGSQEADYEYDVSRQVPSTSEIAQNFSALGPEQNETIQNYCKNELLLRWRSLKTESNSIFSKPQHWRLQIYDRNELLQEYQYLIVQNLIQPMPLSDEVTWTTEIIGIKLYSALKEGESLTSLYIRVIPAKNIDPEVDPLEDPLIRCLYEGYIGSYQKAQLKKLGY